MHFTALLTWATGAEDLQALELGYGLAAIYEQFIFYFFDMGMTIKYIILIKSQDLREVKVLAKHLKYPLFTLNGRNSR